MRIKTEVWEIFALGMRGYLSKRKSTAQVKKIKKRKNCEAQNAYCRNRSVFIKEKINDAGKESLIKRKPAEREMLTAGVVCPMRFERTTFRVGV